MINTSQARETLSLAVRKGDVQLHRAVGISQEPFGVRCGVGGTRDGVSRSRGSSSGSRPGPGSLQLPPGPAPKPCVFGAE